MDTLNGGSMKTLRVHRAKHAKVYYFKITLHVDVAENKKQLRHCTSAIRNLTQY